MGARRREDISLALHFSTLAQSAITLPLHFSTLAQGVCDWRHLSLFSKATKVPFNKKGDDCPLIKLSGIQINLAGRNPYIFVERFFSVALNV